MPLFLVCEAEALEKTLCQHRVESRVHFVATADPGAGDDDRGHFVSPHLLPSNLISCHLISSILVPSTLISPRRGGAEGRAE